MVTNDGNVPGALAPHHVHQYPHRNGYMSCLSTVPPAVYLTGYSVLPCAKGTGRHAERALVLSRLVADPLQGSSMLECDHSQAANTEGKACWALLRDKKPRFWAGMSPWEQV